MNEQANIYLIHLFVCRYPDFPIPVTQISSSLYCVRLILLYITPDFSGYTSEPVWTDSVSRILNQSILILN